VIEEAVIAGGAADGGILWRGPEEPQRGQGAVGGLLSGDPGALDADGVGREREADGGDARELLGRPAIRREAVRGRRAVPEEVEGAVLEGIEECDGVRRHARAPGVVGEATPEGQDEECCYRSHADVIVTMHRSSTSMPMCDAVRTERQYESSPLAAKEQPIGS